MAEVPRLKGMRPDIGAAVTNEKVLVKAFNSSVKTHSKHPANPAVPISVLLTIFAGLAGILFALSSTISGPFVFGDQAVYFNMARDISFKGDVTGTLYNPLYPFLISPFFLASTPVATLGFAKLFNAIVFASGIFPFYCIAWRLIRDNLKAAALAGLAVCMPFGVCSLVTWAEPVYYPLVAWVFAAFLRFEEEPTRRNALWLSLCLPLPFFAKQAGLMLIVAVAAGFAFGLLARPGSERLRVLKLEALVLAPAALLPLGWIIRNQLRNQGGGGLGYSEAWARLAGESEGPGRLLLDCVTNIFHSVVYFSVSLYGVLFVIFIISLFDWKALRKAEQGLATVTVVFSILLFAMSAVYCSLYGMTNRANGRYFDAVIPVILVWSLTTATRDYGRLRRRRTACIIVIAGSILLAYAYSPLQDLHAYAIMNLPGVSFLHQVFGPAGGIIWNPYGGTVGERLLVATFIGAAACLLFLPKQKYLFTCVLLLEAAATAAALTNAVRLARTQNQPNNVYTALTGIGALNQSGLTRPLWIDPEVRNENTAFFHWFWTGQQQPNYAKAETLISEYRFDFGMPEFYTAPGTIKISAPWRPEGQYIKGVRSGFVDISPLRSTRCSGSGPERDVITSRQPLRFVMDSPPGRYRFKFEADAQECQTAIFPVSFSIASGVQTSFHVTGNTYTAEFEVDSRLEELAIDFRPSVNGLVVLDRMKVIPLTTTAGPNPGPGSLFVTRRAMPFGEVAHFGEFRIYAIN